LFAPLSRTVRASVPFPPRFLVSSIGEEGVALGALHQAIETVELDLVPGVSR
jgi:hypothetical protein